MPISTSDIERGKRNPDAYGYTIHDDFLDAVDCAAVLDRLQEQAALEGEANVATFSDHGNPARAAGSQLANRSSE